MHAPLAFLLAAALLVFSAMSFAELATRMPVAASEAAYVEAGFRRNWLTLSVGLLVAATAAVSAAAISAGSAGYVGVFVPLPNKMLVVIVILLMGAIACLATVQSVTFAAVMTVIEVAGLLLIIGAGFFEGTQIITRLPEMLPPFDLSAYLGLSGTALIAVFAFIGFEHIVNVAEEVKEPEKTLPRALFLTLGMTALLYALIVWIAVLAVPPDELSRSQAPLALVFERLTGLPLFTMSLIAIVATLNGVIVHMIMIGRVLYGLSKAGRLPSVLARVNPKTRTPIAATLLGVSVILALALFFPLARLADVTAFSTLVIFAAVNLALIQIKAKEIPPPAHLFICQKWVPWAGLCASLFLILASLLAPR
jgi:amino acid transporter